MKLLILSLVALASCSVGEAQQSPHDLLIAHAQRIYGKMMLRFDELIRQDLLTQHKKIVLDAASVRPELQQGFITKQDNAAQAVALEKRSRYALKIETALAKIVDKQLETDRWDELFQRIDQLPNEISARVTIYR